MEKISMFKIPQQLKTTRRRVCLNMFYFTLEHMVRMYLRFAILRCLLLDAALSNK